VPVDVVLLADDLAVETRQLEELLDPLRGGDWDRPTPAIGWAIRDQISHLAYFDEAATVAAVDPDRFRAERDALLANPDGFTEDVAQRYRNLEPGRLHEWFRDARAGMMEALLACDSSTRVPWYGPDMSIASSLTARIMETWAHGQDVADALGVSRMRTSALRQVAHLGVRTLPNSFVTRGLAVPEAPVFVALAGPDGERWAWGDASVPDRVTGDAVDFCLVVTQRRHLADTSLAVAGAVATQWIHIAQAFAGPPGMGREPSGSARAT
jgi:uncharacterized protein (TIGR03084 family)